MTAIKVHLPKEKAIMKEHGIPSYQQVKIVT
jgi:hypothetical protein